MGSNMLKIFLLLTLVTFCSGVNKWKKELVCKTVNDGWARQGSDPFDDDRIESRGAIKIGETCYDVKYVPCENCEWILVFARRNTTNLLLNYNESMHFVTITFFKCIIECSGRRETRWFSCGLWSYFDWRNTLWHGGVKEVNFYVFSEIWRVFIFRQ